MRCAYVLGREVGVGEPHDAREIRGVDFAQHPRVGEGVGRVPDIVDHPPEARGVVGDGQLANVAVCAAQRIVVVQALGGIGAVRVVHKVGVVRRRVAAAQELVHAAVRR